MSNTDYTYPEPANKQMSHDLAVMLVVMACLLAIFCLGLYKYDQSHNASAQAVTKARTAVIAATKQNNALVTQNKALTATNATLTAQNTELGNEKVQFCTDLAKAKVTEQLCTK